MLMTTAYWCVLLAGLLPYVATLTAKIGAPYDNRDPRAWLARLTGWRARANAAQHNGFEAFPFFAAAVIIAQLAGAGQGRIDALALGFIAARVAHFAAYVADIPTLRSIMWFTGLGCVVGLFVSAA
jgi:uncharacterized MAPEG superfamily protein